MNSFPLRCTAILPRITFIIAKHLSTFKATITLFEPSNVTFNRLILHVQVYIKASNINKHNMYRIIKWRESFKFYVLTCSIDG